MKKIDTEILREKIEKSINDDISNGLVGGAAVCVTQNGEELYRGYFADSPAGFSVDSNTVFRLASMTKPITAVATLILVDRNMISLDDDASSYINGLKNMSVGKLTDGRPTAEKTSVNPITIRSLLNHTSGLISGPVGDAFLKTFPAETRKSLEQVIKFYTGCMLDFETATKQAYSSVAAFDVLARIVEMVSQKSFSDFLADEIFKPLGMADTTFAPTDEQWARMIPMHNTQNGKNVIAPFPANSVFAGFPTTYTCGGAGLASTLDDYLKFARMLLNRGVAPSGRIISESVFEEMTKPQVSESIMPGFERWGLSVRVITDPKHPALPVGSFGWSGAYGTHFWIDPENQIMAVYMKNSLYDGGSGALTAATLEKNVAASLVD